MKHLFFTPLIAVCLFSTSYASTADLFLFDKEAIVAAFVEANVIESYILSNSSITFNDLSNERIDLVYLDKFIASHFVESDFFLGGFWIGFGTTCVFTCTGGIIGCVPGAIVGGLVGCFAGVGLTYFFHDNNQNELKKALIGGCSSLITSLGLTYSLIIIYNYFL